MSVFTHTRQALSLLPSRRSFCPHRFSFSIRHLQLVNPDSCIQSLWPCGVTACGRVLGHPMSVVWTLLPPRSIPPLMSPDHIPYPLVPPRSQSLPLYPLTPHPLDISPIPSLTHPLFIPMSPLPPSPPLPIPIHPSPLPDITPSRTPLTSLLSPRHSATSPPTLSFLRHPLV